VFHVTEFISHGFIVLDEMKDHGFQSLAAGGFFKFSKRRTFPGLNVCAPDEILE
jgi:hypothetical protein